MNPPTEKVVQPTLEEIFQAACEMSVAQRTAYLDEVCAGNDALHRKVQAMLHHHDEDEDFLETPAVEEAFKEIAEQERNKSGQYRPAMIGRQISQYRILALLGKGGMGEVYLAHDNELDVDVAIKFLTGAYADDPEWQARFNREGHLNADLTHQNIAALRHKGQCDGRPFLVFEYIPGQTLLDKLETSPLPVKEALPIFQQLAEGLAHAHSKKIIHRDLKPANIKITPDNQVRILDFGIARRITTDLATVEMKTIAPDEQLTRDFGETIKGEVIGTVVFMSPEQTRGEMLDTATDIWSLGGVMYQTLTGRLPFKGVDTYDTLSLIRDSRHEPDWRALPADTPKPILRMLQQCFVKERVRRQTSAEEIRQTIYQTLHPSRFWPQQPRHQAILVAVTMILLIAAFVSGALLRSWWIRSAIPADKQIVVLPFRGFGDAQAGIGFADDLRRNLLRVSDAWQAVPANDVRPTNLLNLDLQNISRKLGANLIVSGEVQQAGAQLKIKFRVQNSFLYTLEEGEVTGAGNQLATLQSQIAERVADKLKLAKSTRATAYGKQLQVSSYQASEQYLIALGELQKDLNQDTVEKPIEILTRLIQTEGDSARLQAALARAYLNKYVLTYDSLYADKALQACAQAISLAPEQVETYRGIQGSIHIQSGKYDEAIKDFTAVLKIYPRDWEALNGLAESYCEIEQVQKAEEVYKQLLAIWPRHWESYNEIGRFHYRQKDYAKAIEYWKSVIVLLPDSPTGYNNLGDAYLANGQYGEAINYFLVSIGKDTTQDNTEAYGGIGAAYFYQRQYLLAKEYFFRGKELGKKAEIQDPILSGNLGDAYRQLAVNEKIPNLVDEFSRQAITAYSEAIDLMRQRKADALYDTALLAEWLAKRSDLRESALAKSDDLQASMQIIKSVTATEPEDEEVAYRATVIYLIAGNIDESLKWLEKAACGHYNQAHLQNDPELHRLQINPSYQLISDKCLSKQN